MPPDELLLDTWKQFLQEKMHLLDRSWQALDDVWEIAPSGLDASVAELADKFYQAYWAVFHAAVGSNTLSDL